MKLASVLVAAFAALGLALAWYGRRRPQRCIGCGRAEAEAARLVTALTVAICPDCVSKALAAIAEPESQLQASGSVNQGSPPLGHCSFCHGQANARRTIITMTNGTICTE